MLTLLALKLDPSTWVFWCLLVVLVQIPLAIYALTRLFKRGIRGKNALLLHILIELVVIVGPISFIVYDLIAGPADANSKNKEER